MYNSLTAAEKFQSYDYGYLGNYKKYRQTMPLTYDLKKVTASLVLFYGVNDLLAPKLVRSFFILIQNIF